MFFRQLLLSNERTALVCHPFWIANLRMLKKMRSFLGWRGSVLPALVKPFLCVLILSVLAAAKDKDATLPGRCSAVAVDAQKIGVARKWSVILQLPATDS
jgi:hypothetical protein